MAQTVAAAVFHLWQALLLVSLCCAALIISLYCLIFMVPVKRFWERIESLGGGMKGIKSHMEGVANELNRRIDEMERTTQQLVEENRAALRKSVRETGGELQKKVREVSGVARQAAQEMKKLERELDSLKGAVAQHGTARNQLVRRVDFAGERLEQLQSDFESLELELRESTRQLVAESYQQLEATVLSALDAIQNQMLRGLGRPHRVEHSAARGEEDRLGPGMESDSDSTRSEDAGKIISAGPLFTPVQKDGEDAEEEDAGPEQPDEDTQEVQEEKTEGEQPQDPSDA